MNPTSQVEQVDLVQDVHEAAHVSQVLASFKKVPFAQVLQAVSVQAVQSAEHLAQVF